MEVAVADVEVSQAGTTSNKRAGTGSQLEVEVMITVWFLMCRVREDRRGDGVGLQVRIETVRRRGGIGPGRRGGMGTEMDATVSGGGAGVVSERGTGMGGGGRRSTGTGTGIAGASP